MSKIDLNYKLLFIGESDVGKTSLILRYTGNFFESNLPTVGIDVKYKYLTYDDKKIRLDIWDTAGEKRFRGISQNYFRGDNGIIFVFDITNKETFNRLKIWLSDVKPKINPGTVMVVAENKIDLEEKREVLKDLIKEFGEKNEIEIFSTSAKSGEGISEMIGNLVSKLYNNKNIGVIEDDDEYFPRKGSVKLKKKVENNKQGCNC